MTSPIFKERVEMRRIITKTLSLCIVIIFVLSTITFALAEKRVVYSGITEPNKLVSLMLVDPDADPDNLSKEEIHKVEIVKADVDGKYSHYFDVDDIEVDETGVITNYKLLSNVVPDVSVEGTVAAKIEFSSFATSPVEYKGILYVPIEETLTMIGGDTVTYNYDANSKAYAGKANNGEFTMVMGNDTLEVDWVNIELPGVLETINGTNMMPAYAIKYLLKTGDVIYSSGDNSFGLTEGVKEAGYDWDKNTIASKIDQLVDSDTRLVFDSTKSTFLSYNLSATDPASGDNTTIKDDWSHQTFTITYTPAESDTKGNEVAITIQKSDDGAIPFEQDHIGLLHFKARATSAKDESGSAILAVYLQRRAAGSGTVQSWSLALEDIISLPGNSEWQDIYLMADSGITELLDGSWIRFIPQGKASTVEIKEVQFWDFGLRADCADKISLMKEREGYKGIEEDHVWRQEAWNRIEKYRKEDISVNVVDSNGNPVSGAKINVKMTENEFMFGAAICETEVLDEHIDLNTVRGQTLDNFMDNDMNTGVAADNLKPRGITSTDAATGIDMVNEFLSRGKRVRGHTIFWDSAGIMPFDRVKQMTYQELYKSTMDYVRPLAQTFKGKLEHWDVINEPCDSNLTRTTYNTTRLYTDILKEVRNIDPDVKLYINETGIEGKPNKNYNDRIPTLLNIVKQMQEEGAPIDGIGIQAHCTKYYYPQGFYHQLDECASIVDEVSVTEYDFYNGNTDYAPNHLEDTLLATFSHPKATAFIVWGIEDSMHWRWNAESAPFYDRDWNKKPAYDKWKQLTNEEFATNTTLTTNGNGKAFVRAFRGDYEITCTYDGKTITVPLGNTVEGGSLVKFVVGNTISGTASNGIRAKNSPIEYETMTEAKKEIDSIRSPYYKGVISECNFSGSETNSLSVNGGDLQNNSDYQSGKVWGSINGIGGILKSRDCGSVIVHSDGTNQTGDLRLRAEGKDRYEDTELHHETMFYTLSSNASGTLKISTGVATEKQVDTKLADIIYCDGRYYVETIDGTIIDLDKNKLYTLDTAIVGNLVEYKIMSSDSVAATYSCDLPTPINTREMTEVSYLFDSNCGNSDVFKLHCSRLFEYSDGELIEFSDTDYETYVLDETMKNFDMNSVEYLGTSLNEAAENWGAIGKNNSTDGFAYTKNGQYMSAVRSNPNGEYSLVKSFDSISEGESLEFVFNMIYNAPSQWFNSAGHANIGLGSADKNIYINLVSHDYSEYKGFHTTLLELDETTQQIDISKSNVWNKNNLTVKFTLTPTADGTAYDAYIAVMPYTGSEIREARIPAAFTADEAKQINTFFLSSSTEYGENEVTRQGEVILGVKNLKLRKYGKTMYTSGEASIAPGESASLGIMYNNVTQIDKSATIIVAGYDEQGALVSCKTKESTINPGKGAFGFNIVDETDNIVKYKIFLWGDQTSMIPYKKTDVITINE